MPNYLFESSGGCEICEAKDGVHEERPLRPHPNCQCEITDIHDALCFGLELDLSEFGHDVPHLPYPKTFDIEWNVVFDMSVECNDEGKEDGVGTIVLDGTDTVFAETFDETQWVANKKEELELEALVEALEWARDHCDCPL